MWVTCGIQMGNWQDTICGADVGENRRGTRKSERGWVKHSLEKIHG